MRDDLPQPHTRIQAGRVEQFLFWGIREKNRSNGGVVGVNILRLPSPTLWLTVYPSQRNRLTPCGEGLTCASRLCIEGLGEGMASTGLGCAGRRGKPPSGFSPGVGWVASTALLCASMVYAMRSNECAPLEFPLQTITVAIDDNYPPYVFRDESGQLRGYLPDVWALWSQKTPSRCGSWPPTGPPRSRSCRAGGPM